MIISFHKFPEDRELFRKWIVAIRRDVGKEFRVTDHTRVCSRRFKSSDYLTSLTGRKKSLKPTAVPSTFFWRQGSLVKRKSCKAKNRGECSLRASSPGGGGREGERGESLQRCLRNLNAAPNTPRGSLLS